MLNNYDLLIIGGGINGVGIAADAAQRGLSVLLCEQGDFASATSSASSKLIHGGLRYLEHYEFRLVHEALIERQRLLKLAPHLIQPLEFVMPYLTKQRPAWLIRLGLFIYDYLYWNNQLPHTKKVYPRSMPIDFASLNPKIKFGFSYYDCNVLDARLVIVNAIAARNHHAQLLSRTRFIGAKRHLEYWEVELQTHDSTIIRINAKCIVNAAGPWVPDILNTLNIASSHRMSLVQGSHIIIPQLYAGKQAYILQNDDGRVIFTIPYHFDTTLIGTTDINFSGDPKTAHITHDEQAYLCRIINHYFTKNISIADIIHCYCGVRPLLAGNSASPSEISRDYKLVLEHSGAPILSIFGGKITTYRKLAEHALTQLKTIFPHMRAGSTATIPLPGADFNQDFMHFQQQFIQQYPWLDTTLSQRWIHSYGTLAHEILLGCTQMADLGIHFGADLYAREVDYLMRHEWATTADDILWRRTKLGLILSEKEQSQLETYLKIVKIAPII